LKANVTGEIDRKGSKNPLGIIVEANSYKATELQHIKQTLSDTYDPIINEVHKFSELPPELVVQISLNIDITNIITTIVRNPRESILLASVAVIGKKALELIVEDAYKLMKRSVNNFFSSIRNETPIFVFHTKILGKNITITDSSKNAESVIKNLTLLQGRLQSLSIKDVTKIAEAKRIRINMVGKDSFTLQTDGESIDI
ncbi:MAG: hypothetical protein KKG04_10640, partial [Candidatus Thermoplasmatota archaeon]|nr:hypothetical protein [Candidatus Thermoplasmatota archaeon]